MKTKTITEALSGNSYPGRGIIVGRSEDNTKILTFYFIMGRSENSRNRVFTLTDDGIKTEAFDSSKVIDPSLIIYHPVRFCKNHVVVTNGDQTDTICNGFNCGKGCHQSLSERTFEPDGPNFTPRISAIVGVNGSYKISIIKSLYGDPSCCCHHFFEYDAPKPGLGHLIHTYLGDGSPLPSFEGEPVPISLNGTLDDLTDCLWHALNDENKVSLFTCETDIETKENRIIIKNKYN